MHETTVPPNVPDSPGRRGLLSAVQAAGVARRWARRRGHAPDACRLPIAPAVLGDAETMKLSDMVRSMTSCVGTVRALRGSEARADLEESLRLLKRARRLVGRVRHAGTMVADVDRAVESVEAGVKLLRGATPFRGRAPESWLGVAALLAERGLSHAEIADALAWFGVAEPSPEAVRRALARRR